MHIPDNEILFRYAKPQAFPDGQEEIPTFIFQDKELSCDWSKYRQDPCTSFHLQEGKTVIICIKVCDDIRNPKNPKRSNIIETAWKQEIVYDPISITDDPVHGGNNAHSLIRGSKKGPVTIAIRSNSTFHNKSTF